LRDVAVMEAIYEAAKLGTSVAIHAPDKSESRHG
jgi:hypothetical protein